MTRYSRLFISLLPFLAVATGSSWAAKTGTALSEASAPKPGAQPGGPNTFACPADNAVASRPPQNTNTPGRRPSSELEHACGMSLSAFVAGANQNPWQIVDVRSSVDFQQGHATGAINLPPAFIKSKSFLKGQRILLVDSGKGEEHLLEVCVDLRERGYKETRVLIGGMVSWLKAGGSVSTPGSGTYALAQLSPQELYLEELSPRSVIVDVLFPSPKPAPTRKEVGWRGELAKLTGLAESALGHGSQKEKLIILAGEAMDAATYGVMSARFPAVPVFVYTGSKAEYAAFLERQRSLTEPRRKSGDSRCSAL